MKPSKRTMRVLQAKLRNQNPNGQGRVGDYWCLLGTPTEIILLVDTFKVVHNSHPYHVKWIRNYKKEGHSNPMWFYFHAGSKKLNQIFGDNRHESQHHRSK